MRVLLATLGLVLFGLSVKLGYDLLMSGKLSGAEFISLVIAFAIIGLILSFASEVQEFSVARNIVKLKEVKKDVEHSIGELKVARTETFRFLLSLAKRFPVKTKCGVGSCRTPQLTRRCYRTNFSLRSKFATERGVKCKTNQRGITYDRHA